jgi:hypothetical protein
MEQLLLFDLCQKHSISKRKSQIPIFFWHYWNPNEECEGCNLGASIKMIKETRSFLLKRERYRRNEKNSNSIIKIRKSLRKRLGKLLKHSLETPKYHKGKNQLIGCSSLELKDHLEKQWQPGMTWKNWGKQWHVDHIKPCSLFDVGDPNDLLKINHFTNLQPLWAIDNIRKGNKYVEKKTIETVGNV